ncbi:MAG: YlbG family protein [Streptococcaceae bacterium]|jgi:uncharacterized protein YlbG (UPF0298 family)|nr:YlbG family protein [Streptococcaceae bacterium]
MVDITTALEQTKPSSLDIVSRTAIYVFYNNYKYVRQLSRFGDMSYSSKKARYALLYVNTDILEEVVAKVQALHFVKEVRVSVLDDLDRDFSTAFHETVEAIKKNS